MAQASHGPVRQTLLLPEVSSWLGIPEATLRWWRTRDEGPRSGKLGNRIVYLQSDVQAWLDAQLSDSKGQRGTTNGTAA